MAEVLFQGRKLEDLKVMEIKEELGRRGLNKKGIKAVLMKRLEAALLTEKRDEENVTVDVVGNTGMDGESTGIANDIPPSTDMEKLAESEEGDDTSAALQEIAYEHGEGDTMEEECMEEVEEAPVADEEMAEETTEEACEGWSPAAADADPSDERNLESFSSSMEFPHPHEEELIYEGDVETDIVKEAEQSLDTKADDTGEEVIFDLSKEVGIPLDATDNEQKTSFSDSKLADENSKQKVEISAKGKPASTDETSRCSNLWVSGLVVSVSAADLKTLFSPFGQVISAKVVVRARSKGHRYGYVTMATSEQAQKSIKALHNTELKGWKIAVELAKSTHPKSIGGSTQESDVDASALVEEEGNATNTVQETKEEKSETDVHVEDGGDGVAQAKEPDDSVSDAANTTTGSKEDDKESPSKVESKQAQPAPSGSTSGRRIIVVDKGDGKKELVRVGSAYGKGRQPLLRSPPKSLSPPLRITRGFGRPGRGLIMSRLSPPRNRGDARFDLMRGGMEHRSIHSRLGHYADPRADPRALEMQLHEERQRMLYQREMERQHLRRELEIEQRRKEQMFLRQMEEVRAREAQRRNIFEQKQREAVERERLFHQREQQIHEKERMIQEMERREKDRLEALEKQKEREYRERERRFREQLEKEMKEKEAKMLKERELREQQLRIQEQELRDKQNRLREEQERQAMLKEQERREQERQRRLQEEEIRKERERIREQERKEQQSKAAAKRPFPGDHSDIPAKRQSFSPDTDSRALYAPFARGGQGGNARDNHQGSLLGKFDSSELGAGRSVTSPYARNQSKPKEGMTGYPHATPVQNQSGMGGLGYGSRGPSSQFGGKLTSPGYDPPRDGVKGRSPYGSLTPELISAASRALGQVVAGGSLDRNKDLGRGSMRGGHSRLPMLGQRSLGAGYLSDRSLSDMVSYPSVFSQSRAMSQPDLPSSGGFRTTRASGYRDLPGDHWYDQGGYSSSRGGYSSSHGGYSSARRGDYRRM